MSKNRPYSNPRFQIIFFDNTFKTGLVKPYDRDRKILSQYKEYFEDGKIKQACQRAVKAMGSIDIMYQKDNNPGQEVEA